MAGLKSRGIEIPRTGGRSAAPMLRDRAPLPLAALQGFVGAYCAAVGALVLIAPHQIGPVPIVLPRAALQAYGVLITCSGLALAAVPITGVSRRIARVIHVLAGLSLLVLGVRFWGASAFAAAVTLLTLGAAVAAIPWLPSPPRRWRPPNVLSCVAGATLALSGVAMILLPSQYTPILGLAPALLVGFGVGFVAVGAGLLGAQFSRRTHRRAELVSHLSAAVLCLSWLVTGPAPGRVWPSILLYGGFGVVLAVLPWVRSRSGEAASLRVQLGFMLAVAASLPLIGTATIVSSREEAQQIEASLSAQAATADRVAERVADHVGQHRGAVAALAEHLAVAPPALQLEQLEITRRTYPDLVAIGVFDVAGRPARWVGTEGAGAQWDRIGAPDSPRDSARVLFDSSGRDPVLVLASPIQTRGDYRGQVAAILSLSSLATSIARAETSDDVDLRLVDGAGLPLVSQHRTVASPWPTLATENLGAAQLHEGSTESGTLIYPTATGRHLSAVALIPTLGWRVIVDRSEYAVLASVRAAREAGFSVLFVTTQLFVV